MSAAAEESAAITIRQLNLKGSRRALLEKIAELIPEGQTMTAPIAIEDVATLAGYHEQSMRRAARFLVTIGALRIVGGGQGRQASYELLALPGAGADPLLPLMGRARPPARPSPPSGPLFDHPAADVESATAHGVDDVRANDVVQKYRCWWRNIVHFARCWSARCVAYFVHFGTFARSTVLNFVQKYRSGVANIVHFARSTRTAVGVGSRAPAREDLKNKYEEVVDARAREADAFVAWFETEYAARHDGARCTIERAPDGGRVYDLLRRGRTVDRLKAMTLLLWSVTTDAVQGSDRWYIAERVPVRNIWLLHRKADFLDLEVTRALAAVAPEPDVWTEILHRIELKLDRHTFYKWFRGTELAEDHGHYLTVAAKTDLDVGWIQRHYADVVRAAAGDVRPGLRVDFVSPLAKTGIRRRSG